MEQTATEQRVTRAEWVAGRKRQLRLMRWAITALCAAVAVMGLLLLILPSLRIKRITVTGNTTRIEQEIVSAAGIAVGDETFKLSSGQIADNIQAVYPMLGVRVKRGLSEITIEIVEQGSAYIAYAGHWFLLDDDLTVVTVSDDPSDFAVYPRMVLPAVRSLSVGGTVNFYEDGIDRGYIPELIALLREEGLFSHVTYLDVSEKYDLSYVLDGQIRVVLGKLSDVALKLEMTEEILGARFENDEPYVIVDVSDPGRMTYRAMQSPDQLLTY